MSEKAIGWIKAGIVGLLAIGILALILATYLRVKRAGSGTQCLNNLGQIGRMIELYRKSHGGQDQKYPSATGAEFHEVLRVTVFPEGTHALWQCPHEGNDSESFDYRGPAIDMNQTKSWAMKDIIAGDHPDNHGDAKKYGVNALSRGYQLMRITSEAPQWQRYMKTTAK